MWALIVDDSQTATIPYCGAFACASGLPALLADIAPSAGGLGYVPVTAMTAYATNKVRVKHGISGEVWRDCCKSVFCEPCTLQQARNEQLLRYKPGDMAPLTQLNAPGLDQMSLR